MTKKYQNHCFFLATFSCYWNRLKLLEKRKFLIQKSATSGKPVSHCSIYYNTSHIFAFVKLIKTNVLLSMCQCRHHLKFLRTSIKSGWNWKCKFFLTNKWRWLQRKKHLVYVIQLPIRWGHDCNFLICLASF